MTTRNIEAIHQIMIIDGMNLPTSHSRIVQENIQSARNLYPDAKYILWDGSAIRQFLTQNFSKDVVLSYDILNPYAYKCDLARYCLLYKLGGLYIDLAVRCTAPLNVPADKNLLAFRDLDEFSSPSWTFVNQAYLWAVPSLDEFEIAIDMVVNNCRTGYYGANPLYPTGPVLFGRALVAAMASRGQSELADTQWIGKRVSMTGERRSRITGYVTPDYETVGINMKHIGGDLEHIGVKGSNNYNDFWYARNVYKTQCG